MRCFLPRQEVTSPMQTQKFTIVICTHNRVALLLRTLSSINDAYVPTHSDVDILIVANACTDATVDEVSSFYSKLPLRCIIEPIAGKSLALNRAIAITHSDYAVFIDDDHRVALDFFEQTQAAIQLYPDKSILCGKIIPDWTGTEPDWVHDTGDFRIFPPPIPSFDLGDMPMTIGITDELPGGGDLVIKLGVFHRVGQFSVSMGPIGHDLAGGEDSEFLLRALKNGEQIHYIPSIIQYHYVDPERLKFNYLFKKSFQRSRSITLARNPEKTGIPNYLWRKLATYTIKVIFAFNTRLIRFYLMRVASTLGEIEGFRGHSNFK